jgi:hypothetical protein
MPLYIVSTERFGDVTVEFDSITDARRDARRRFGVKNPRSVRAYREYRVCDVCDSAPCCCPEVAS